MEGEGGGLPEPAPHRKEQILKGLFQRKPPNSASSTPPSPLQAGRGANFSCSRLPERSPERGMSSDNGGDGPSLLGTVQGDPAWAWPWRGHPPYTGTVQGGWHVCWGPAAAVEGSLASTSPDVPSPALPHGGVRSMASTHPSPALPPLSGITPRPSPVTGGTPGRVGRTYHVLPVAASQLLLCLKRERRKASPSGQHPVCPGPSRGGAEGAHQNRNVPDTSSLRGNGLGRGWGGALAEEPYLPGRVPALGLPCRTPSSLRGR